MRTDTLAHLKGASEHLGTEQHLDGGPRWSTASVSAPKGGGALKSIAESFRANPATGSGTASIPITVTAARGLEPQLALSYDSGAGNGPYGHGWSLSLGQISRKTDKGLPRYLDQNDSDVFVLSDAEDLVPRLVEGPPGTWLLDERDEGGFKVRRYRPRVEGAFARIERWTSTSSGEVHWRVRDRGNVLRTYGQTPNSRLADPEDATHVFSWLLDEVVDDRGNRIVFEYVADSRATDGSNVSTSLSDSARRNGLSPFVQVYPRRVRYGNATPHALGDTTDDFLFQLVFDWGDLADRDDNAGETGGLAVPTSDRIPLTDPPERDDPFSTRRPGFEVRTRWRCERVVLFHAIDLSAEPAALSPVGLNGAWLPVASWRLRYDATSHLAKLLGVTRVGWRSRHGEDGDVVTEALAMPEVKFAYVEPRIGTQTENLGDGDDVPTAIDGSLWRFVDLDGEGLPGLLTEQAGGWWYQRNEGDPAARAFAGRPWFRPPNVVRTMPNASLLQGAALADVDGDGRVEVVTRSRGVAGTWTRTESTGWESFRRFRSLPNLDFDDPDLRMVDLTGDGLADLVKLANEALRWWPSRGLDGYGDTAFGEHCGQDETRAPVFLRGSVTEATYLADMTGDGLSDIVRVHGSGVCYWPNLGYGRFGAQVQLGNSPRFPRNTFDPARVRLVDTDGSGTTDLVYLGEDGALLARNLSGNAFADVERITAFPLASNLDHIDTVDLLGDGTACLVWSSGSYDRSRPKFVRLMADGKPHLLTKVDDGTGVVVTLEYAPSTRFYVDDRAAGRPWATRLPFPVQCLARVETTDHAREHTIVTRYAYHHGYFDGAERAFRGFGRVDQSDTESAGSDVVEAVVPVRRSTWFHTGAWLEQSTLEEAYAAEWFTGDADAPTLEPNRVASASTLTTAERRESARALKGRMLREEVWRDDGSSPAAPYAVTCKTWETRPLQPRRAARNADDGPWSRDEGVPGSFLVVERGTLTIAYDEKSDDPRVGHQVVLDVDDYGTPRRVAALAYPRRGSGHEPEQTAPLVVVTSHDVVHDDLDHARWRLAVPWQTRRFEVGGLSFPAAGAAWTTIGLGEALDAVTDVGPHAPTPATGSWRRLAGIEILRYADPTTGDPLEVGAIGAVALPYDVRTLAMTTDLFGDASSNGAGSGLDTRAGWVSTARDAALVDECGYVLGSYWAGSSPPAAWDPPAGAVWASSGATTYDDAAGFRQPVAQTDPFGTTTTVDWGDLRLKPVAVSVPVGTTTHEVAATYDAHTLQPVLVSDVNASRTAVAYDALGRVTKVANLGRVGETVDDLDHPTTSFDYTFARFDAAAERWTPTCSHASTRRHHWLGTEDTAYDETWVYFDGLGRKLTEKAKAAAGVALLVDDEGTPLVDEEGELQFDEFDLRYVVSGRVILDAKGNPVKQYEPYFSSISGWEPDATAAMQGVTPILHYDPLGRLVRTDHPDGTFETLVRSPWEERHYDRNDTLPVVDADYEPDPDELLGEDALHAVLRGFEAGTGPVTGPTTGHPWLDARATASVSGADRFLTVERGKALRRSAGQSWFVRDTPTIVHADVLGRPFLEQRAKSSAKDDDGCYTDTTDVHVTLDVLGHATRVAARYQGASARVEQLATADVFDLLGRSVRHVRRDAQKKVSGLGTGGTTWVLPAVDGQPARRWDSRDQAFISTFDTLRRPVATSVQVGSGTPTCLLFTRYGEQAEVDPDDAKARRLFGQPWKAYDTAGLVTTEAVDVDGRVTESTRRFAARYFPLADWSEHVGADPSDDATHDPDWVLNSAGTATEEFTQTSTFDVTGRPMSDAVFRDSSAKYERRYTYDAGGHLTGMQVRIRGSGSDAWQPVVHDIAYNARGQRIEVMAGDDDGNPALRTSFTYDPATFRLLRLRTDRLTDDEVLQDFRWVHDAAGNITFQEAYERPLDPQDTSAGTVWYANAVVTPHRRYVYDALDRLIEATGREHDSTVDPSAGYAGGRRQTARPYGLGAVAHRADGGALRTYTQRYTYDDIGNFLALRHIQGGTGGATFVRTYAYVAESDGSLFNNQLQHTTIGNTDYHHAYDAHGNTTSLSHLPDMAWDPLDRLQSVQTQARYPIDEDIDPGHPEDEVASPPRHDWFYLYDGSGQRVRKVRAKLVGNPETPDGMLRAEERFYVGPFEVWRKYDGSVGTAVERETLHVMDDQRRVAMAEALTWDDGEEVSEGSLVPRWRYQLDDHLGTSVGEVTELGEEIGWEEYHPYGTSALSSFHNTREVSSKRYRYTGMERDEETGLQYNSKRFYSAPNGRWLATDPIGVADGLGTYCYCRGSPTSLSDPTGAAPPDGDPPGAASPDGLGTTSSLPGYLPTFGICKLDGSNKILSVNYRIRPPSEHAVRSLTPQQSEDFEFQKGHGGRTRNEVVWDQLGEITGMNGNGFAALALGVAYATGVSEPADVDKNRIIIDSASLLEAGFAHLDPHDEQRTGTSAAQNRNVNAERWTIWGGSVSATEPLHGPTGATATQMREGTNGSTVEIGRSRSNPSPSPASKGVATENATPSPPNGFRRLMPNVPSRIEQRKNYIQQQHLHLRKPAGGW